MATYTALRYDISVSSLSSLNPAAPSETRFLVKNESAFSIYNVFYNCYSAHVRLPDGRELTNSTVVPNPVPELRAHSSYSVRCQHPLGAEHINAGVFLEIHVFYTPTFLPWVTKEGGQQFLLVYDKDGNTVWLPQGPFTHNRKEMESEQYTP